METKVIQWMDRDEVQRLLQAMKAPAKQDDQLAARPAVVVLEAARERENSVAEQYRIASL